MSMQRESTIVERSENIEKLPDGLTSPIPGPTLEIHVTTAEKLVEKSKLSSDTMRQAIKVVTI